MNSDGGITFKATANFDSAAAKRKFSGAIHKAQMKLDQQVITDSSYYVPKITHTLEASATINTVIGSGLVVWRTDYARKQYYGVDFDHSKQFNPNACARWFEAAKARKVKQWEKLVNDTVKNS